MKVATIDYRMNIFLHQFGDYGGLGLLATIILTIPVQEIGILVPILSGLFALIGQGFISYRNDRRKQARHDLFMKIGQQMVDGKRDFDKDFMDRLDDNAD